MNLVVAGLVLILLSALAALFATRWSAPALLGVVAGLALAAWGFVPHTTPKPAGTVLASDRAPQPAAQAKEAAVAEPNGGAGGENAAGSQAAGNANTASQTAPAIPEHLIPGKARDWVSELKQLVERPNRFSPTQSGAAPEDAPNKGDRIYEYVNLKLAGRTFQTVFLSKNPDDPETWMVHVEPGAQGAPVQPEELGKLRVLGEGSNFIVFKIEDGPFARDFLIWATGGHRGGGEAVRVYSPKFLEREHGLAQQIARSAGN